jgi:hypothetical protein
MDAFASLISETGRLVGIDSLEPDADGVVEFASENATVVVMRAGEDGDVVLVTAKLFDATDAAPDARRRALEANFAGDFTVSVDPDDGSYHLSDYAPIRCLSPDGMLAWLESFSSELLRLRAKFAHFSG